MNIKECLKNGNKIKIIINENNTFKIYIISYDKGTYTATDQQTNIQQDIKDIGKYLKKARLWKEL